MTRVLLPALLAVVAWPGGPAAAEDAKDAQVTKQRAETIDGLVRIVGAQAGSVLYCRKLYTMNDAVSEGQSRTVRRALNAAVGRHKAQAAVAGEGQRGASEIAMVGAEQWCADQRDILNTDGVRVFADGPGHPRPPLQKNSPRA